MILGADSGNLMPDTRHLIPTPDGKVSSLAGGSRFKQLHCESLQSPQLF